jgi:hypothetical protein
MHVENVVNQPKGGRQPEQGVKGSGHSNAQPCDSRGTYNESMGRLRLFKMVHLSHLRGNKAKGAQATE